MPSVNYSLKLRPITKGKFTDIHFYINSICLKSKSALREVNILELGKWLSKNDALKILNIIQGCLLCESEMDYNRLIEEFNKLIFFDCSISALVDLQNISCEKMNSSSINNGYPREFLETYTNSRFHLIDPLYEMFFKTSDIQSLNQLENCYDSITSRVLSLSHDFGLNNTLLFGIGGSKYNTYTILTISGQNIKNDRRTKAILEYLVPYLSIALKAVLPLLIKENTASLTSAELEILKWLKEGKSTWEIAKIVYKSERAVIFHIGNIIKKLNANNRTHAVAVALAQNLIAL